jgi:predicted DNA-binding transcriptional regulator YafY
MLLLAIAVEKIVPAKCKDNMSSMRLRLWRCLRLLNMLQSRIGYSISYLAREFEVSKRTIYRDIRFLEEAGIPICYDPQKGGHILPHHFNLCVSKLSGDELTALLLAGHIFSLSCVREISHSLHQAITKLLAQVPISFRENIDNLLNSIRGIPSSALWPEGSQAVAAAILSAISQKRQVRIVYDPPVGTAIPLRTKVTPHCLMASEGRWYLIGRSSWHRKVYRFDLKHIQIAEQVDNSHESMETTDLNIERLHWPNMDVHHDSLVTSNR